MSSRSVLRVFYRIPGLHSSLVLNNILLRGYITVCLFDSAADSHLHHFPFGGIMCNAEEYLLLIRKHLKLCEPCASFLRL